MNWPERQAFWEWWQKSGPNITPIDGHDMSEHAERVAEITWANATNQNRAAKVYQKALEKAVGHIVACGIHEVSCEVASYGLTAQIVQEFIEWAENETKGAAE